MKVVKALTIISFLLIVIGGILVIIGGGFTIVGGVIMVTMYTPQWFGVTFVFFALLSSMIALWITSW